MISNLSFRILGLIFLLFCMAHIHASSCKSSLNFFDVLNTVRNNHPVIKMAVISNKISDSEITSARGAFDLRLISMAYYNRFNSSSEMGVPQYANMYSTELELLSRYGMLFKSGYNLNDGDIKTPIQPTGDKGEYFVSIDAPILRGARFNTFSVNESLSEYNLEKTINNYRLVALELLLKTVDSYWKWVAAKNKLRVEKKLLNLSEFRLQAISKRVDSGDMPTIDIIEVNQEIQTRKSRVIQAERYYQKVSYELSWFLWDEKSNSTYSVLDCDNSDFKSKVLERLTYNVNNAKMLALKNRPELKNLSISKSIANLEKEFAENDLLPKLDFALKAGKQMGSGKIDGAVIKGGLEFELPIQRREAQGRVVKYNLAMDQIDLEQKNTIQKIFLQVEDSVSAINMAIKNLQAIVEEVKFAKDMEDGENKKFDLGDSTLFVVNRRERSTAEAKLKLIDSLYEYYLALGYFNAVTGQLL